MDDNTQKGPEDFQDITEQLEGAVEEALEDDQPADMGKVLEGMAAIQKRANQTLQHDGASTEELNLAEMAHTMTITYHLEKEAQTHLEIFRDTLSALGREGVQMMREFNQKSAVLEAKIRQFQAAVKSQEALLQSLQETDMDKG